MEQIWLLVLTMDRVKCNFPVSKSFLIQQLQLFDVQPYLDFVFGT